MQIACEKNKQTEEAFLKTTNTLYDFRSNLNKNSYNRLIF